MMIFVGKRELLSQQWKELDPRWKSNSDAATAPVFKPQAPLEDLHQLLQKHHAQALYYLGGYQDYLTHQALAHNAHLLGLDVIIPLPQDCPPLQGKSTNIQQHHYQGRDFIIFHNSPIHRRSYRIKGFIDLILAATLILASSPLWLLAALLIKLSDPQGSIFFKQQRSGLYGTPFQMWKFRSMYIDAESKLVELRGENKNIFKLDKDPRIIPFGGLIRKTSIDELPQLINILRGEMSLIGPRPLPLYETNAFPTLACRRRLCVKPGLSCYWQIEGRSDTTDLKIMVEKDGKYIDGWSLGRDLNILLRTIPAVLTCKGAK